MCPRGAEMLSAVRRQNRQCAVTQASVDTAAVTVTALLSKSRSVETSVDEKLLISDISDASDSTGVPARMHLTFQGEAKGRSERGCEV